MSSMRENVSLGKLTKLVTAEWIRDENLFVLVPLKIA